MEVFGSSMEEKKSFGQFIAMRRNYMQLTQEEMADRVGVSKSAIAKWETDGGPPDRDNLRKLAEIINVSVDDLHRVIRGQNDRPVSSINITDDVIGVLESYGYRVLPPGTDEPPLRQTDQL